MRSPSSFRMGFSLKFCSLSPLNQEYNPPDLLEGAAEDPLSLHLWKFSQQMTSIDLEEITIGKELFWPLRCKNDLHLPFCPNLASFCLEYNLTPSGGWYFEADPEEDLKTILVANLMTLPTMRCQLRRTSFQYGFRREQYPY